MADRAPQFPIDSYDHHQKWTKTHPIEAPGVEKSWIFSSNYCLPNADGEYRRYAVASNNEGFIYGQYGGTDTYILGAIACPRVLKCADCPLE